MQTFGNLGSITAIAVRSAIVIALLLHLPALSLVLAAAGSTLSRPEGAARVGYLIVSYIVLVVASLVAVAVWNRRKWAWAAAGSVSSFLPFVFAVRDAVH